MPVVFQASTIVDKDKNVEGDEFVVIVGWPILGDATKTHPKWVCVTSADPIERLTGDWRSWSAAAEGKTYKNYVVPTHLGVDTTITQLNGGSTLAEALLKMLSWRASVSVTVIDGHSHTVESTTYLENVTWLTRLVVICTTR